MKKEWYLYAGEFLSGWKKKVKVKGSVSKTDKPKSAKRGDDSFETCFDLVPYKGGPTPYRQHNSRELSSSFCLYMFQ